MNLSMRRRKRERENEEKSLNPNQFKVSVGEKWSLDVYILHIYKQRARGIPHRRANVICIIIICFGITTGSILRCARDECNTTTTNSFFVNGWTGGIKMEYLERKKTERKMRLLLLLVKSKINHLRICFDIKFPFYPFILRWICLKKISLILNSWCDNVYATLKINRFA